MRYQNWDLLLFPGDSRTPIQEFDTKCFVLGQNVGVSSADVLSDKYRSSVESMTLIPILTSFVASLEHSAPFRISIHSWEKPKPSQLLLSYKTPDEAALFEARVFIDGVFGGRTFDENVWPEVIGDPGYSCGPSSSTENADGTDRDAQYLRFPKFHREILQKPDWEPGELIGRIKVVIAEGVLRENTPPAASVARFDRLRDVVAFSFQHAPQDILEYSNIAWPNAKMFVDLPKRGSRPGLIGSRASGISGHEAHSHSPQRLPPIASRSKNRSTNDSFQRLFDIQNHSGLQSDPISKGSNLGGLKNGSPDRQVTGKLVVQDDDPFVCSHQSPAAIQHWRLQLRSTSHDISMLDYTSSKTDRSVVNTEMSGVSVPRANFVKHMNEANPVEIVQALSPARRDELFKALSASNSPAMGIGTRPPTNTPQMSTSSNNASRVNLAEVGNSAGSKLWQEPRQRPRTSSESSLKSTAESRFYHGKEYNNPRMLRELSVPAGGNHLLPVGPRSLSLTVNRQRSASNGSKRKRGSASPATSIGKMQNTIRVVVGSSTSPPSDGEREEQNKARPSPSPERGISAIAD